MTGNYLTVTALTRYIKRKLDTDPHLKNLWLQGEISNFKHHSRGHMYLTIKDDQTRIQAVMFAGNNRRLKFIPENGMQVLIKGEISVFEPYGQYQLYIQQMEPDGLGALYLAYEQLKKKLESRGYFAQDHKKSIPIFPRNIGIVTSPTGAAVRDIITTIKRRYPLVNTTIIPVLVQGATSAESIKKGIEQANKQGSFDLLIVGRGGGSIEELWSFNEEIVANAIYQSTIPIISAVGHETDTTISDYVADLRAPTPTSAAELAVPSRIELMEKVTGLKQNLIREMNGSVDNNQNILNRLKQSYAFRYPEKLIEQKEQAFDRHTDRLKKSIIQIVKNNQERYVNQHTRFINQHPAKQLEHAKTNLDLLTKQKKSYMSQLVDLKTRQLTTAMEKLSLLNPLEIMKRGFALPYTTKGNIIKSIKQVQEKDIMNIKLSDGAIDCQVLSVEENNNG